MTVAKAPKKKAAEARVHVVPEPGLLADVQNKRRPRRKQKSAPILKDPGSWLPLTIGLGAIIVICGLFYFFGK